MSKSEEKTCWTDKKFSRIRPVTIKNIRKISFSGGKHALIETLFENDGVNSIWIGWHLRLISTLIEGWHNIKTKIAKNIYWKWNQSLLKNLLLVSAVDLYKNVQVLGLAKLTHSVYFFLTSDFWGTVVTFFG